MASTVEADGLKVVKARTEVEELIYELITQKLAYVFPARSRVTAIASSTRMPTRQHPYRPLKVYSANKSSCRSRVAVTSTKAMRCRSRRGPFGLGESTSESSRAREGMKVASHHSAALITTPRSGTMPRCLQLPSQNDVQTTCIFCCVACICPRAILRDDESP